MAEFGKALNCVPTSRLDAPAAAFEVGVVGLSGVGKSSLLNALIAPTLEMLPSGGVGPLTGVPIRVRHARVPTLRVTYRGGAVRQWHRDTTNAAFLARIHEHISGPAGCESLEVGWPSSLLETGVTIVDLPGLGIVDDAYSQYTDAWLAQASAVLVVTDRAGVADSLVTSLRRSGFLARAANGRADLIGVVTKLDQVADDVRRHDRSGARWSSCFRSIAQRAEVELLGQLTAILRYEQRHAGALPRAAAHVEDAIRVFGVSSLEHHRVVERNEEQRPRLYLAESSGIPSVRRALTGLARLRSSAWTSELFDRVCSAADRATLLPELFSLVDMEGL